MPPSPKTQAGLDRLRKILDEDSAISYRAACIKADVSYRSAYRYLGPSGRKYIPVTPSFTKEAAVVAFKDACQSNFGGDRPTSEQFQHLRNAPISHRTLFRLFGTWDAVLEAAGYPPINWKKDGLPRKMRLTSADMDRIR